MFGLSTRDVRILEFDVAEKAGVTHPFNQTKRLVGKDWFHVFFSRNKDLGIHEAQATDLARALIGLSQRIFFEYLRKHMSKLHFRSPTFGTWTRLV